MNARPELTIGVLAYPGCSPQKFSRSRRHPDSQSPYVDEKLLAPAGASFPRTVQRHLERNLSARTFLRHYKAETGEAPSPPHRVRRPGYQPLRRDDIGKTVTRGNKEGSPR
jgi:hypothetical protein